MRPGSRAGAQGALRQRDRVITAALISLLCLCLTLLHVVPIRHYHERARLLSQGVETSAVVIETRFGPRGCGLSYRFRTRTGEARAGRNKVGLDCGYVRRHGPGATVRVAYDAADPERSYPTAESLWHPILIGAVLLDVMLLFLGLSWLAYRSRR